jgi:hypothetical protein
MLRIGPVLKELIGRQQKTGHAKERLIKIAPVLSAKLQNAKLQNAKLQNATAARNIRARMACRAVLARYFAPSKGLTMGVIYYSMA